MFDLGLEDAEGAAAAEVRVVGRLIVDQVAILESDEAILPAVYVVGPFREGA